MQPGSRVAHPTLAAGRRFLAWLRRAFPQPNLRQRLALLNGCRHERAQLNQKSFAVFWIFDPLGGKLFINLVPYGMYDKDCRARALPCLILPT